MNDEVAKFVEDYRDELSKSNINDLENECSKAMQRLSYGNVCYLTSGSASENTTEGSSVVTSADTESTAKEREKCVDWQLENCRLFDKGNLLSDENNETTKFLITACAVTRAIPQCSGSDCSARYEYMN